MFLAAVGCIAAPVMASAAVTTTRVSVSSTGGQANGGSTADTVSANGRYVLFDSQASNLVAGDSNGTRDVFLRDRVLAKTFRVSLGGGNRQANHASFGQALSTNARFVVFLSRATNLITGDTNGRPDVFVRDRRTGQVHRVSIPPGGGQFQTRGSVSAHISANGRFVLFTEGPPPGACGDAGVGACRQNMFVRDRARGVTHAVDPRVKYGNGNAISNDGRLVLLSEYDEHYVLLSLVLRNRATSRETEIDPYADGCTCSERPWMTPDAGFVAFSDLNAAASGFNTYRWKRGTTTTDLVDDSGDSSAAGISNNGRYIGFLSGDPTIVAGDTNNAQDLFRRDLSTGMVTRVDLTSGGAQIAAGAEGFLSANGAFAVFQTRSRTVVPNDTNRRTDVFIRGPLPP